MRIKPNLDYKTILANKHQPISFALQLNADTIDSPEERSLAFCVVLDRSGSMNGKPLEQAKKATSLVVKNLRPNDQFALVTFDEEAQTFFPLQTVGSKAELSARINSIQVGGATNLTGGWALGRDELKKCDKATNRRLLLLSDGVLNRGITEPDQVGAIVAGGLENEQVRTSCLGFGNGYNEDLLSELSRLTNGQFYDANDAEQLPAIFESELDGLQKISAQNIRVRLKPLDFCENLFSLGEHPSVTLPDGRIEFALGDLISGEEQVACWAMEVLLMPCIDGTPVTTLEDEDLLEVEVLYDEIRKEGLVPECFKQTIKVKATQDPAEVVSNGEVVSWAGMQRAGKAIKDVTKLMNKNDLDGAMKLLEASISQLRALGDVAGLDEAIKPLVELETLIQRGAYNRRYSKVARYRSSEYMRMKSHSMWSIADAPAPVFKRDRHQPGSNEEHREDKTDPSTKGE